MQSVKERRSVTMPASAHAVRYEMMSISMSGRAETIGYTYLHLSFM